MDNSRVYAATACGRESDCLKQISRLSSLSVGRGDDPSALFPVFYKYFEQGLLVTFLRESLNFSAF